MTRRAREWQPGDHRWIEHITKRVDDLLDNENEKKPDAIAQAERLGTLNQIDRSRQYQEPNNRELLRAVNEAWAKIRTLEREAGKKDQMIGALNDRVKTYRAAHVTLIAIITGLAWEGLKVLAPICIRLLVLR